jgi:hypothetical protein
MFLCAESQGEVVTSLAGQFKKFGQNEPNFFNHGRPRIGLNHEPRNVVARSDPNASLRVPTSINDDRSAHLTKIVYQIAPVNP